MSQNRRSYNRAAYDKNRRGTVSRRQNEYIYGNTVRKLDFGWEEAPVRRPDPKVRKNAALLIGDLQQEDLLMDLYQAHGFW